jgi:hypothetical protein
MRAIETKPLLADIWDFVLLHANAFGVECPHAPIAAEKVPLRFAFRTDLVATLHSSSRRMGWVLLFVSPPFLSSPPVLIGGNYANYLLVEYSPSKK